MATVPPAIEGTKVVGIRLVVGLHRQIRRAHDLLPYVVNAMEEVAVVLGLEQFGVVRGDAVVDARQHILDGCQRGDQYGWEEGQNSRCSVASASWMS
jgi:hypothetical protein